MSVGDLPFSEEKGRSGWRGEVDEKDLEERREGKLRLGPKVN